MSRLKQLNRCELAFEFSDHDEKENRENEINFKNTLEWKQAYEDLKNILSKREHVAKGTELVEKRNEDIKNQKTFEHRNGRF